MPSVPGGKLAQFSEAGSARQFVTGEKAPSNCTGPDRNARRQTGSPASRSLAHRRAGGGLYRVNRRAFPAHFRPSVSAPGRDNPFIDNPLKDAMNASVELPDSNLSKTDPEFEQALAEVRTAALEHHERGRIDEAESLYRMVLDARPGDADINYNLGVIIYRRGQYAAAVPYFEVAVGANPNQGQYWSSYIEALTNSGEIAAAWVVLEMAQQRGMKGPVVNTLIAGITAATKARKAAAQALSAPQGATPVQVQMPPAPPQVAASAAGTRAKGRLGAVVPTPQELNRTVTLYNQGRVIEAAALARSLTERFPTHAPSWRAWGLAMHRLGRTREAIEPLGRAIDLAPNDHESRRILADALRDQGLHAQSEAHCRVILQQDAQHAEAHRLLGMALQAQMRFAEAEASCRRAAELAPMSSAAGSTLGVILIDQGLLAEAEVELRRTLALSPGDPKLHENLLFCMSHNDSVSADALFAQHLQFGEQCERQLRSRWKKHLNSRDPERRLNVGIVSGDLLQHAVASFVEPLLPHLASDPALKLHVYYNYAFQDQTTLRLKQHVQEWNDISGMSDDALVEKIRADRIDMLIDLSGHTGRNRLLAFARKPAPLQASWIGYPGTTGLQAMDYYFADRFFVPPGHARSQFTEKIAYLPAAVAFTPEVSSPPVNGLPALRNDYFTFGSFNRVSKIRPATVALWAKLLHATPGSRMFLGAMPPDGKNEKLVEWFANEGIARDRLEFRQRSDAAVYLQQHHHVDICLDTFPYSGGTTTMHATWMGVPTLTLPGDKIPSRAGMMIMSHVGLDAFIARDADDFVVKGLAIVSDLKALAEIRAGLRERFRNSPLLNSQLMADSFSLTLRSMWRHWCAGDPAAPLDACSTGALDSN
jgi:predicted O-linked N-acetylglucosamine transferase (SPINDLY family)